MHADLDTRPWNLLASLAFLTGCGGRLIGSEGADDGTSGATEADGPECVSDADCPSYGYYCYSGVCTYAPHHDGHLDHYDDGWYYECYVDEDCGDLALCEFNYCNSVESLPACGTLVEQPTPLAIPAAPLALTFVDVDGDGAAELVVATADELHVFDSASPDVPLISPRGVGSPSIDAMVGGELDGMPGGDLMILAQDQLLSHASDGVGNMAPALPMPSMFPGSFDLRAGDLDGVDPTEVLVVAQQSAGVLNSLPLETFGVLDNATLRGAETAAPGFTVQQSGYLLTFFDALGFEIGSGEVHDGPPSTLASVRALVGQRDVVSSRIGQWTLFNGWDPANANSVGMWGLSGWVSAAESIDLLGDGSDDLALLADGLVLLHRDPFTNSQCLAELSIGDVAVALAAGDFDGDGDDELAVRTGSDMILIYELD